MTVADGEREIDGIDIIDSIDSIDNIEMRGNTGLPAGGCLVL